MSSSGGEREGDEDKEAEDGIRRRRRRVKRERG